MRINKKILRGAITLSLVGQFISPVASVQAQETVQINPAIFLQLQEGNPVPADELNFDVIDPEAETGPAVVWSHRVDQPAQEPLALNEGNYTLRIYDEAGFNRDGQQLEGLSDTQPSSDSEEPSYEEAGQLQQLSDGTIVYDIPFTVSAEESMLNESGEYVVDFNVILANPSTVSSIIDEAESESDSSQETGQATVQVVDEVGTPIPGAAVTVGDQEVTTDESGNAAFTELPAGDQTYTITSVPETYTIPEGSGSGTLTVTADTPATAQVIVQPVQQTGQATVQVVDEVGTPVPGATVTVGDQEVTTDESGNAAFTELPAGDQPYTVTSVPETYTIPEGSGSGTLTVTADTPATAQVIVQPVQQTGQATVQVVDQVGTPIPGATVIVGDQEVTTDESGNATFSELPAGDQPYTITSVPETYTVPEGSGSGTLTLTSDTPATVQVPITAVQTNGTVTVTVVNPEGTPIPNVGIQLNEQELATDESGNATFSEVPTGDQTYTVSSVPEGYELAEENQTGTVTVTANETAAAELTLETMPQTGQLSVTVVDEAGQPVSDVSLEINNQTVKTNNDGQAALEDLQPGEYPFTVLEAPSEYEPGQTGTVTISPSQENTLTVTLTTIPQYGNVTLKIIDQDDQPVEGATVTLDETEYTTNANGEAIVENINANQTINYTLNSLPEKYTGQAAGTIDVTTNETATETIRVERTALPSQLNITILDQNNESVVGAELTLNNDQTAETNENGVATFGDLPEGEYSYQISSLPETYTQDLQPQTVQLSEGQTLDRNLAVNREIATHQAKIQVIDQENNPVEGAEVTINDRTENTNSEGHVIFDELELGTYTYQVTSLPEDYEGNPVAQFEVVDSDVDLTAQVTRQIEPGSATVQVLDQNNEPVAGVELAFGGLTGTTDGEGYATFEPLPVGMYNYSVVSVPEGYTSTSQTQSIDITEGMAFTEDLKVQKEPESGNVVVEIVDDSGNPIPGVTVTINDQSVQTNDQGQASFENLPVGEVTYEISNVPENYTLSETSGTLEVTNNEQTETRVEVASIESSKSSSVVSSESASLDESQATSSETTESSSDESASVIVAEESLTEEQQANIDAEAEEATRQFVDADTGIEVWVNPQDAGNVVRLEASKVNTPLDPQPQSLDGQDYDAYELTLLDRNNQPVELTRVARVEIPTRPVQSQLRLVRINDDSTSNLTFGLYDQTVSFNTQQLGTYGIVYGSLDENNASQAESESVNVEVSSSVEGQENLPGTGETSSRLYLILGVVVGLAGLGIILFNRRKETE